MIAMVEALEAARGEMKEWLEHMHRNPELSMQEHDRYVADIVRQ